MSLRDRINNPDRRQEPLTPLVERRNGEERREPRWVERMRDGELSPKDLTGKVAACWERRQKQLAVA